MMTAPEKIMSTIHRIGAGDAFFHTVKRPAE
jgi:hypothetical protein